MATYDTKKRYQSFDSGCNSLWVINGVTVGNNVQYHSGSQTLITAADGEWRFRKRVLENKTGVYPPKLQEYYRNKDCGHNFDTWSNIYNDVHYKLNTDYVSSGGTTTGSYDGNLFAKTETATPDHPLWPARPSISDAEMIAAGTVAIANTLPKNSVANCYTGVSEILRDGIPHAPLSQQLKERTAHFRDLGDEYLNIQFGWKPFVKDLKDIAHSAMNSHSIISQLERDSGKHVRRSWYFPTIQSTTNSTTTGRTSPVLDSRFNPATGLFPLDITTVTTTKMWFKGCYTYWFERGDNLLERMRYGAQRANYLYGILPTPDNIWKATPWSWAADWIGNTGAVLHNMSALADHSQVMRWGYVMCTKSVITTYTLRTGPILGRDLVQTFGTIRKRRMRATPYGFGLNPATFTAGQWAIIAALGISRTPKSLNNWP